MSEKRSLLMSAGQASSALLSAQPSSGSVPMTPSAAFDQPSRSLSGTGVGVAVGDAVALAVGVAEGVRVAVAAGVVVPVAIGEAVAVGVRVAVAVGDGLADGEGEGLGVPHGRQVGADEGVGLAVLVGVAVAVAVGVGVGVQPGQSVAVAVGVAVGVRVGVAVAVPVGVGVGVQDGQGVGDGVGLGPPDTGTHGENSEVYRGKTRVVAVTLLMTVPGTSSIDSLKEAFPWLSVVSAEPPSGRLPSITAGSQGSASAKKSIKTNLFGELCSVPSTVRTAGDEPEITALVRTGKFCRLLGPVSASRGSLGVTPSGPRSIPSPSLR